MITVLFPAHYFIFLRIFLLHNGAIEGLVVSSMLFGAIVGAGGSGPLSDRIGRRRLVLFIALVFIVGSLV